LSLLHNQTVRHAFRRHGMYVCPHRKCVKPIWAPRHWPEIDINVWEIDTEAQRVKYWRSEEEKNDPIREAVFSKYNDFDLALLYPLTRLSIGTVDVPVPARYEDVLRVRYPHSYGWSLPYNPRCWWSALTSGLPSVGEMAIYTPPDFMEVWGVQRESNPGDPPVQFLWKWEQGEFETNPAWIDYMFNVTQNAAATKIILP
jgi:hypothetical protein